MSNIRSDRFQVVSITVYCECGRPMMITVEKGKMDKVKGVQLLHNPKVRDDTPK